MRFWVGITDHDWYRFLSVRPDIDEVNFWQPTPRRAADLAPGTPFLFKLHAADGGRLVGGGVVARYSVVPLPLAWEAFQEKNGAPTFEEMVERVDKCPPTSARRVKPRTSVAGSSSNPFFLPRALWIDSPPDWAPNIVQGKTYDDESDVGRSLWATVSGALATRFPRAVAEQRYGTPIQVTPRLGQGGFRFAVTDAYSRRCAITEERTLPALDAAHIVPYSQAGEHRVDNGLLLRKDLHALFDGGYVSITPGRTVVVSRRIHDEFENGRDYYALDGRPIRVPEDPQLQPSASALEWHYTHRFLDRTA